MELMTQKKMAYQQIKEDILNSKWAPGTKLVERRLGEEFGVSRTPIREAFNQLEKEGLVEQVPKWGVFVKELNEQEILEMYEVREVLEGLAARLAVLRANEEDIGKMKQAIAKMELALGEEGEEDTRAYNLADNEFHVFLVNASHNKKLIELTLMCHIHVKDLLRVFYKESWRDEYRISLKRHRDILDCIVLGNAVLAEELGRKHITKIRKKAEILFEKKEKISQPA